MSERVHGRIEKPTIAPSLATPSEPLSASTVWGKKKKKKWEIGEEEEGEGEREE